MKRTLALAFAAAAAPLCAQAPKTAAVSAPQPATIRVVLTTSLGPVTLELERAKAPITVANFLRYVDQKRFDGISFYRRSKVQGYPDLGFVQGGTTDPKRVLPPIAHEPTTKTGLKHEAGAISMARLAPGTARADFIIAMSPLAYLDANPGAPGDNVGNAVFGRVVEGMEVMKSIHNAPVSPTRGEGPMKGEMLEPPVKILTARRAPPKP
jgi:peptidyl-prolyl cis-trans isomerase A (cyclophilin A)